MDKILNVVVIGSGPAGLAAAAAAGGAGASVIMLESSPWVGGQYFRHHPDGKIALPGGAVGLGDFLTQLSEAHVSIHTDTLAWTMRTAPGGGFEVFLDGVNRPSGSIRTGRVVLAAGAYERVVPFPGWTLPGVMTTGAVGTLAVAPGALRGSRALVYGSGPLLWPATRRLVEAGVKVTAVLEYNRFPWQAWKLLPGAGQQTARLQEGWGYLRILRRGRVPYRWNARLHSVVDRGSLEVTFSAPAGASHQVETVDLVFTGFGLQPSLQLAQAAGVRLQPMNGEVFQTPVRDGRLQTSIPGLYVVGDGVYTMGKEAAALEGWLAGLWAAEASGGKVCLEEFRPLERALAAQRSFTRRLLERFPYPYAELAHADDRTLLCRCEQITFGEVRSWLQAGVKDPNNLKALTRLGMGRCQGRFCGGSLAALLQEAGEPGADCLPGLAARPPAMPVRLDGIIRSEVAHES